MRVYFTLFIGNILSNFIDSEVQFLLVEGKDKLELDAVIHGEGRWGGGGNRFER